MILLAGCEHRTVGSENPVVLVAEKCGTVACEP